MNFDEFAGNKKAKSQIISKLSSGKIPRSIIIEGRKGLGKFTLARLIAKAVLCESGGEKPCGVCESCREIDRGTHPDVIEFTKENNFGDDGKLKKTFGVGEIREKVIKRAYETPSRGKYKFFIIKDCDGKNRLNTAAQNAFLKTLEEPPSKSVFILSCENKSLFLPTILSRCEVIPLEGVPREEEVKYISSHFPRYDNERIEAATEISDGSIGRAVDVLKDKKTQQKLDRAERMCEALTAASDYELLTICADFIKKRDESAEALELLQPAVRDAVVGGSGISSTKKGVKLLRDNFSKKSLINLYDTIDDLKRQIPKNPNLRLFSTKICYSLRRAVGR